MSSVYVNNAPANITGEMAVSDVFPLYSTANKQPQINLPDIKLIIMTKIIRGFTIAFKF
jgi:hypothetical protein